MKIVHLNKNDLSGGAARAAYRLHKGLQGLGHQSSMVVVSRASDDPSVMAVERPMDLMSRARRGLSQYRIAQEFRQYKSSRPSGYELFSDDRSEYASPLANQMPASDVINLHWVSGFVDYDAFFRRNPQTKPIVWTLHDLNPLTGGCHYDLGCGRYVTGCGACPQLGSSDTKDLSYAVWKRKQKLFSGEASPKLHFVTPSEWLAGEVKRSPFFGKFPVRVIPHGLDLKAFAPRNRDSVRDLLGIRRDARVLLFVAEDIGNKRKGFPLLLEALAQCSKEIPNLLLLSLGKNKPDVPLDIPWVHVGSVDNDLFLSMVYSAADLFAVCSLQEAYGLTVLEAMACGVPVVGYAVGGIPDMVRNGVNGLTASAGDVRGFASAISSLLNSGRCAKMGACARQIALEEYSLELQARRYAELYESLV